MWDQPPVDEWIKRHGTYSGIVFSCREKGSNGIYRKIDKLNMIILRKIRQIQKDEFCLLSLKCRSQIYTHTWYRHENRPF